MDSSYRRLTEWSIFEGAAEIQAHVIARRRLEAQPCIGLCRFAPPSR
jgi:hypothetical protein